MTLGIPAQEVGYRQLEMARYRTNGTRDTLFSLGNDGAAYFIGEVSLKNLSIRGGADLAEPFAMSEDSIAQGSVVVIDAAHPGQLKLSILTSTWEPTATKATPTKPVGRKTATTTRWPCSRPTANTTWNVA